MGAWLWVVDIQNDFMQHDGKLHVPGAEDIIPNIEAAISLACRNGLVVIFTSDWHYRDSKELSEKPDFITTFPEHCMAGSDGAKIINNLSAGSNIMEWTTTYTDESLIQFGNQEITIQKDAFDVFAGNPNTNRFIEILKPEQVYVIGVAGNVCVNQAVLGFAGKNVPVTVFTNCIKDLPNIPSCLADWQSKGVILSEFNPTAF